MAPPPPNSTLFPYTTLFRSTAHPARPHHPRRRLRIPPQAPRTHLETPLGHRHHHRQPHPRHRLGRRDRKSTRLNSSHLVISYAVFCLKKKRKELKCDPTW